jgi:hypothetical protein
MYIWATMAGTPGGLSRIDPITGAVAYMTFGTGYDNTNEIAFHGGRMLLTFYQTDFGVGRICMPDMIPLGSGGGMVNPMTTSQDMIVGGASGSPTRLPKGADGSILGMTSGTVGWVAGGGSMVYPGAGIPISTGSAWAASIANNSANWETAYTDRLKWDGGSTGLVAATGRTSLGLGDMALETKANYALLNNPTFITGINLASTGVASFNTDDLQLYGNGEGFISSKENNVAIGVKDGGGDFEYVMKAAYNAGNSAFEANYNGSKVFETDADGVNIPTGKVYQVNGTNGVSGTYTNPSSITVSGGIITAASSGTTATIYTTTVSISAAELSTLNGSPKLLIAGQAGKYIIVHSVFVKNDITDATYAGGDLHVTIGSTSIGPYYTCFWGEDFLTTIPRGSWTLIPYGYPSNVIVNTGIYAFSNTADTCSSGSITLYITYTVN